jgi:hypothetical protein
MQVDIIVLVLALFLLIFSIIDFKTKSIPSVFLTGILFIILAVNFDNLMFGLLSLVFALFLYEFRFFGGVADLKVMAMIGLMISSMVNFNIFIILVVFYGIAWKLLFKWRFKGVENCPFIPVFLFVYITLYFVGGLL